MKMMKSLILAAGMMLAACATPQVSQAQLAQAKGVSYSLETTYTAALQIATTWANKSNRCAPTYPVPPPLCSTAQGIIDMEARRLVARSALTRLDAVIADAQSNPDMIATAILAAQQAVAAYNDIVGGVK